MKAYRKVNVKEYSVACCGEYNISLPDAEGVVEAEETAVDVVEMELIRRDVDELDTHVFETMNGLMGYIVKLKINMVVPVYAGSYEEALRLAEGFLDDMILPAGITCISVGAWDSALTEEKSFLLRCKGA